MAILTSCCWCSVKSGSFASGVFTLALYTIVLTAGTFHLKTVVPSAAQFIFTIVMLVFSAITVVSSVLLLVGLCVDNRPMLLPWIVGVSLTTLLDIVIIVYFVTEATFDWAVLVMLAIDFFLSALHIYCILCVVSQYQCYVALQRRGGGGRLSTGRQLLARVKFHQGSDGGPCITSNSWKLAQNGAVLLNPTVTPTATSTSTSLSFRPTDLSSISEEPSSYIPSVAYDTPDRDEWTSPPFHQGQTTTTGHYLAGVTNAEEQVMVTRILMEGDPLLNPVVRSGVV